MSLSSLIVQREIATIRQVEEALARQVLYGGDLLTNLLEVTSVDEWQVATLAAESARLPAAPVGALMIPPKDVLDHIPAELAVRRGMMPLAVRGDRVVLAVAEPLAKDEEEQLAFALGMRIEQTFALHVRLRQALASAYGAPLDRRLDALLLRLSGQDARLPSSRPPLLGGAPVVAVPPRPASVPPYRLSPAYGTPLQKVPEPAESGPDTDQTPAPVLERIPTPPPVPVMEAAPKSRTTEAGFPAPHLETANGPSPPVTVPPPVSRTTGAYASPTIVAPPPARTFVHATSNTTRPVRRRRGPLTAGGAEEEMKSAEDRDAILDLMFEFVRQYFDFAAVFVVHGETAEGRDAFGNGAAREKVIGIGVPLGIPSMLARARSAKEPTFVRATEDDADAILRSDLERPATSEIVVAPVLVRGRCVAIVLGDIGVEGSDRAAIADALAFVKAAGAAFERIIVKKKLGGFTAAQGPASGKVDLAEIPLPVMKMPPRTPRENAARAHALGRAVITGPKSEPPVHPTPPDTPSARRDADAHAPRPKLELASEQPDDPVALARPITPQPIYPLTTPLRKVPSKPPPRELDVRRLDRPPIPREDPEERANAVDSGAEEPIIDDEPVIESGAPALEEAALDSSEEQALLRELGEIEDAPPSSEPEDAAPASQAIAVGPRRPPAAYKLESLPSIMVDMDQELVHVIDRILAGKDDGSGEGELLRQGSNAMPALISRFPGPLAISRNELADPYPKPRDCGPLLRLIAIQRRVALPYVLEEMRSGDSARRFWATFLLTELPYPEAIPVLVPRFHDADARVRGVARAAARALPDGARETLVTECARALRDPKASRGVRLGILDALSDLREPTSVPILVRSLGDEDAEVQMASRRALIAITKQDFALDQKRWLSWWGESSSRHRVEWLIDALEGETPALRKAAADELKVLTRQTFGYYEDLPKRDRERIQQRYRDWWVAEGRGRFARARDGVTG